MPHFPKVASQSISDLSSLNSKHEHASLTTLARRLATLLLMVASAAACMAAPTPTASPSIEWTSHAGDAAATRWSVADDITAQNVDGLRRAWEWRTEEKAVPHAASGTLVMPGRFQATPVMRSGTLYLSTPHNRVVALNAADGRQRWAFDPGAVQFGPIGDERAGFVHRGVALWEGDGQRRVLMTSRWWLIALDADTGVPISTFGDQGRIDLASGLRWPVNRLHFGNTSPPLVSGNVVIVGSSIADGLVYERDPPGDVQAFDVRTGKPLWRWEPVPAAGTPGSRVVGRTVGRVHRSRQRVGVRLARRRARTRIPPGQHAE
jgi:quinoprotein glucose dehydrogenase